MTDEKFKLFNQIHDCKGMQFHNRMKGHSFSYNIFTGNLKELKDALNLIENPEIGLKLMSQDNQGAGTQAHREINRLFHNFLASAKTLIEHTRIFVNKHYTNTSINRAYKDRIKSEFVESHLSKFVQDLRNYMLHQGLPSSQMSISFTKENPDIETTIRIEVNKIAEWSRWSSSSKKFLAKQGEFIKLSTMLVEPYGVKITELYDWLDEELYKHHHEDLMQLEKLQKQYSNLE